MTITVYMDSIDTGEEVKIEAEVSVETSSEPVDHPDGRHEDIFDGAEIESVEVNGKRVSWERLEALVGREVYVRLEEEALRTWCEG